MVGKLYEKSIKTMNSKLIESLNLNNQIILPAELYFILDKKNASTRTLIEWTVKGLLFKNQIIFEKLSTASRNEEQFFLINNANQNELSRHEFEIAKYLTRKKYTSLREFTDKLSLYVRRRLNFFGSEFLFKKYLCFDLEEKELIELPYKTLFLILKINLFKLSPKALSIKHKMQRNLKDIEEIDFFHIYSKIYNNYSVPNINEFMKAFYKEFDRAIDHSSYGKVGITDFGKTYPTPLVE